MTSDLGHSDPAQGPRALFAGLEPIDAPILPDAIPLYPADPAAPRQPETWEARNGERWVRNVTAPTLTPILPSPGKRSAAVIIAPGGAFRALSMDNEGLDVARWLASRGVAAFLLKYRLVATPTDTAGFYAELEALGGGIDPAGMAPADAAVTPEALADGQEAVRRVRERAAEWNVDPRQVGLLGFSAGAITAVAVGLNSGPDARPDFIAPIYPSMFPVSVAADAPPMFAVLAANDPLFGAQGFGLVESWRAAKRPVEFHYYERGGHGFGAQRQGLTADGWMVAFEAWLAMRERLDGHC